jgi:hypothetical protein
MDFKYIIVYGNNYNQRDEEIIIKLINKFNFKIYFYLTLNEINNYDSNNNRIEYDRITEIAYIDSFTEDTYIGDAEYIFYLNDNKFNKLSELLKIIVKYNKQNVFYNFSDLTDLDDLDNFQNLEQYKFKNIEEAESLSNMSNLLDFNSTQNIVNKIIPESKISLLIKKKNEQVKNGIIIITYYIKSDLKILDIIQKKCILENLKNTNVNQIIIIGDKLEEELKDSDILNNSNIVLHQSEKNVSFYDLIEISGGFSGNNLICILRSDIILLNQNSLNDLEIDLFSEENQIFALSRIERLINGNLVKCDKLNRILYSTEQDGWIFKSPIKINNQIEFEKLKNIYLYDKFSHLYFNKILKDNGYNIINNSKKYKIIRILHENNLDSRLLFDKNMSNNNITNLDNIYLLPDNEIMDKISFEQLLKLVQIDDNELYKLKCDIFDKYLKNKIFRV